MVPEPGRVLFHVIYRPHAATGSPGLAKWRPLFAMRSSRFRTGTPSRQERKPRKIRTSTRKRGRGSDEAVAAPAAMGTRGRAMHSFEAPGECRRRGILAVNFLDMRFANPDEPAGRRTDNGALLRWFCFLDRGFCSLRLWSSLFGRLFVSFPGNGLNAGGFL